MNSNTDTSELGMTTFDLDEVVLGKSILQLLREDRQVHPLPYDMLGLL